MERYPANKNIHKYNLIILSNRGKDVLTIRTSSLKLFVEACSSKCSSLRTEAVKLLTPHLTPSNLLSFSGYWCMKHNKTRKYYTFHTKVERKGEQNRCWCDHWLDSHIWQCRRMSGGKKCVKKHCLFPNVLVFGDMLSRRGGKKISREEGVRTSHWEGYRISICLVSPWKVLVLNCVFLSGLLSVFVSLFHSSCHHLSLPTHSFYLRRVTGGQKMYLFAILQRKGKEKEPGLLFVRCNNQRTSFHPLQMEQMLLQLQRGEWMKKFVKIKSIPSFAVGSFRFCLALSSHQEK